MSIVELIPIIDQIHPTMQQVIFYIVITCSLSILFAKTPFYKPITHWLTAIKNKCIQEIKIDIRSIDLTKHVAPREIGKFSAWILMFLLSMISMWFLMYGTTVMLQAAVKAYAVPQAVKFAFSFAALIFFTACLFVSYWFKGCAYRVARENYINLKPWQKYF